MEIVTCFVAMTTSVLFTCYENNSGVGGLIAEVLMDGAAVNCTVTQAAFSLNVSAFTYLSYVRCV